MNNLVCIRSSTIKSMVLRLHRCRVVPKVAGGMPLPRTRPLPSHRPIATSAVMAFPYSARSPLCHHFAAGFSPLTPSSYNCNYYSSTTIVSTRQPKTTKRIPRKAALALTPKARNIFRQLIAATGSQGIILKYEISSQHALRMAFKFDLIKDASKELSELDEGVSLEVAEDGVTPKSTTESWNDNLPKLYIHHAAFMKVLGGTLDAEFDTESGQLTPKLIDREGHEMDPNA